MIEATINDIRLSEYGLMLTDVSISEPMPNRQTVTVPHRNGKLDLSFKPITYQNRKVVLTCAVKTTPMLWEKTKADVYAAWHGQDVKAIIDDEPDYYWAGFCEITSAERKQNQGTIKITIDAYPYRMAADTELLYNGDGSEDASGWYNIIFTAGDAPTGCKGYFKAKNYLAASQTMAYDPDGIYQISGWHRIDAMLDSAYVNFGLCPYDIDGKKINVLNARKTADPMFTLAKELKKGDTKIYLNEDISKWRTSGAEIKYQCVSFFNYVDSKGNSYDDYTRNVYLYVYEASGINPSDNSITLKSAWAGDTYAAGTNVARTNDGSTYTYYYSGKKTNKDWKHFEHYVIASKNSEVENRLVYATKVDVRPDATMTQSDWAGLSFKKMPGKNVTVATTATTVTIKNEGSLNIIPMFIGTDRATVTVSDGTNSYSFSGSGEHKSANIILEAGKSTTLTLTATSSTNVGITWREGKF